MRENIQMTSSLTVSNHYFVKYSYPCACEGVSWETRVCCQTV